MNIKKIKECLYIYISTGLLYVLLEILYRGYSDITMFFLAGLCGLVMMKLNDIFTYEMDFLFQIFVCAFVVTIGELIVGLIFNQNYSIWDYRMLKFNFKGQISLVYSLIWCILSAIYIPILDYIEWKKFNYLPSVNPYYKFFGKKIFQFKGSGVK